MKLRTAATTLALAAVLAAGSARTAVALPANFADAICPQATQYAIAVSKLAHDDPPEKAYETNQAAVDAYARCSREKATSGFREPAHYAQARAAGFAMQAGRALIALNRRDDARREIAQYRAVAQSIVDWRADPEVRVSAKAPVELDSDLTSGHGRNAAPASEMDRNSTDRRASIYFAAAKDIVAEADELLRQLDRGQAAPASAASGR